MWRPVQLLGCGLPVNRLQLVEFVRSRGLAVVATRGPGGAPQAALVGIAVTDSGELLFDTATDSRKCVNLRASPRIAVVIGWDDEVTLQCEGTAEVLTGTERDRCLAAYLQQYPDGRERADNPNIVLVRVCIDWGRLSDYRPGSFGTEQLETHRLIWAKIAGDGPKLCAGVRTDVTSSPLAPPLRRPLKPVRATGRRQAAGRTVGRWSAGS